MVRSDAFCEGGQFYCYQLAGATPEDERDIMAFEPVDAKGAGLISYLQRFAFPDEDAGLMRTYLVRDKDTDELAAYFSLKAGLVTRDEEHVDGRAKFDTVPGVELANFAVNGAFRRRHEASRGCGKSIFQRLVMECVRRTAAIVGVSVVYLFALPEGRVIDAYRGYGFERLPRQREDLVHARLKPRYDSQCVFMYLPI